MTWFAIPAGLFVSISSSQRSDITSHGSFIAVLVIAMLVVYAVTLWLLHHVFGVERGAAAAQSITVAFPNYATVGLALSSAVVGKQGAIAVAICVALGAMTVSPITLALMEQGELGPDRPGSALSSFTWAFRKSLRRPIFWSPMLAFVLVLCGVHTPYLVDQVLTPIGYAGAGGGLFLTGLMLSQQRVSYGPSVAYGVITKNALMPLLVWGLSVLFGLDKLTTTEAVLLTAIPSAFFGLVYGAPFGIRLKETGSTLMLSTVASVVSLSVVIAFLT